MKHPIARTSNGTAVYVDLIHSQAAVLIGRQPRLLDLVKKIIAQTAADAPIVRIESNMGRAIGYNFVVKTSAVDTVLYAQLVRDVTYTRFVKNGKPITTKYLSLILRRDDRSDYELHELWLGRLRPARPGSDGETAASRTYWADHAFVLDSQPVQPRTITKVCPY